jgi:hypothetical protein
LRIRQTANFATTDPLGFKLRDDGPLSARKLKVLEIAAITGGSVVVTAAGVAVGYLVYRKCQKDLNSDDCVNLVFISNEQ